MSRREIRPKGAILTQPMIGERVVRVQPTAPVSDWLYSVAEVLPLAHRAMPPYTLGEAVAEYGAYAQATPASGWNSPQANNNRDSLRSEVGRQAEAVGERLGTLVIPLLEIFGKDSSADAVVSAAARFAEVWCSETARMHAFDDLCHAAAFPAATSRQLRLLSAIIASQVGRAAQGPFSLLSLAADALVNTEAALSRGSRSKFPHPLTESDRLEMATNILVAAPTGQVVVWTAYYRATTSHMREVAGPMTFLNAEWALPNAFDVEVTDFPERAELREIREDVYWLDEAHVASLKKENRIVLVRVDLGERQTAGAVEEAQRRVEALLSVAVEAGGTSWRDADAFAVLLDGEVRSSSLGLNLREVPEIEDDSYGMGATAQILSSVADQLGAALSERPMPDQLVEALTSLREARMTDHRDVLFHGAHRVTPRIATALEDHAMELIASVLTLHPKQLMTAAQRHETLVRVGRRIADQLMAPLSNSWAREGHNRRQELKHKVSEYASGGPLLVSIAKAVDLKDEIRELRMSNLERADLEDALDIVTDPGRERLLLEETWLRTNLLRARHRRVRNSVNHGLPLDETTLNSVREFADATSSTAWNMALTWFKSGTTGEILIRREEAAWSDRTARIDRGESWAAADARIAEEA